MKNINFPSNWYLASVMINNDDVVTDTSLTIDWLEQNDKTTSKTKNNS